MSQQHKTWVKMGDLIHKRNIINTLFICPLTQTSSSLSFFFNKSSLGLSPTLSNYTTRLSQSEHSISVWNIPPDAGSASLHLLKCSTRSHKVQLCSAAKLASQVSNRCSCCTGQHTRLPDEVRRVTDQTRPSWPVWVSSTLASDH